MFLPFHVVPLDLSVEDGEVEPLSDGDSPDKRAIPAGIHPAVKANLQELKAAICVAKMYDIDPVMVKEQGFIDALRDLIRSVSRDEVEVVD